MPGELILNEVAVVPTPASSKDSIQMHNAPGGASSRPLLTRVDSSGNAWFEQEIFTQFLASDFTASNATTGQKVFNSSANGAVTLPAGLVFQFQAEYLIFSTFASATAYNLQVGFNVNGGTATLSYGMLSSVAFPIASQTVPIAAGTPTMGWTNTINTAYTVAAVPSATAASTIVKLAGVAKINGAGTFIPQFVTSVAPTTSTIVKAGSFFRATPVGNGTGNYIGNWS